MTGFRRVSAAWILAISAAALGQTPGRPATSASSTGRGTLSTAGDASNAAPSELKVSLMDGSVVAGKLSVPEILIETKFGSLKIPVDQIKSFAPGLSSHPELDGRITSLVNDLAADAFPDREKAERALATMGPQITGELQRQLKAVTDEERKNRLQKILEDFASARDDDADTSHDWTRDDVIVTPNFTIVGHITTNAFAMITSYGTLQLKIADVREARRDSIESQEMRRNLSVSGNIIGQHTYVQGFRVNKGDQLTITATGSIVMSPWGGNAHSSPEGVSNYGTMQPGNFPTGCLIARIGLGGTLFKVGEKVSFTADRSGVIEFGIAMPGDYNGNQFPGAYELKIRGITPPPKD